MSDKSLAFFMSFCDPGIWHFYSEEDLKTESKVEQLFWERVSSDHTKAENDGRGTHCFMSRQCWQFLIEQYGFEKLYAINNKVGWLDVETLDAFMEKIYEEMQND